MIVGASFSNDPEIAKQIKEDKKKIEAEELKKRWDIEGIFPECKAFFKKNTQYGMPESTQPIENWREGRRQRVYMDNGRNFLVYCKEGAVITLWEDQGEKGRVMIWDSKSRHKKQ